MALGRGRSSLARSASGYSRSALRLSRVHHTAPSGHRPMFPFPNPPQPQRRLRPMTPHQHAPNPEQLEGEALAAWKREEKAKHEEAERLNQERRDWNTPAQLPDLQTEAYLNLLKEQS